MKLRFILSLVVAVAIVAPGFAQVVNIPKEYRVVNFGEGFCAWCSIEMLGKTHKIEKLYNLTKNRANESDFKIWDGKKWVIEPYVWVPRGPEYFVKEKVNTGGEWAIYSKLKALDVRAKLQTYGNKNIDLINYAMKNKLGCVFAIEGVNPTGERWAHAMVLIDFNEKEVMYIDPNDIEYIKTKSRTWFNQNWTGYLVVIEATPKINVVEK